MAYLNTATAPFGLEALRARIRNAVEKRRVYRTTLAELSVLSNRELADLGIARSMIKGIAIEAAYGK